MTQIRGMSSSGIKRHHSLLVLLLVGSSQLAVYGSLYFLGDLAKTVFHFLADYVLLFAIYALTILFFRISPFRNNSRVFQVLLFVFPILFRIPMLLARTGLSTDIYRYMWDGMLSSNGVDPYRYVPSSPELQKFRDVYYYEAYDHKDEFTIYPPFAQLFFAASYLLFSSSQLGFKFLLAIFDVLNGVLVARLAMKVTDESRAYLAATIYLWNPLVVIEFSGSGHIDALAIFLMLLSIYFLIGCSRVNSFALLTLSFLTKWISIAMMPIYAKYLLKKKQTHLWMAFLSIIAVSMICVLPFYMSSGFGFIGALLRFVGNWRFESALSRLLELPLKMGGLKEPFVAKVVSYAIVSAIYLIVLFRFRISRMIDVVDCSILGLCLLYFVLPAVYPWYAIWLLALVSLLKCDLRIWLSIVFSGIVIVNYLQQFWQLSDVLFWGAYVFWYVPVLAIVFSYISHSCFSKESG